MYINIEYISSRVISVSLRASHSFRLTHIPSAPFPSFYPFCQASCHPLFLLIPLSLSHTHTHPPKQTYTVYIYISPVPLLLCPSQVRRLSCSTCQRDWRGRDRLRMMPLSPPSFSMCQCWRWMSTVASMVSIQNIIIVSTDISCSHCYDC